MKPKTEAVVSMIFSIFDFKNSFNNLLKFISVEQDLIEVVVV